VTGGAEPGELAYGPGEWAAMSESERAGAYLALEAWWGHPWAGSALAVCGGAHQAELEAEQGWRQGGS
jgi:hypothetical protein